MNIKKMEELLLQEMEDVKGGVAGTTSPVKGCICESGADKGQTDLVVAHACRVELDKSRNL